jgi:hypothetical protein
MNRSFSVAVVALFVISGCSTGQGIASGAVSPSIGGAGPSLTARPSSMPTAAPSQAVAPSPTALPSASNVPAEFPYGPMKAGTYTVAPFAGPDCSAPPLPGCSDVPGADSLRFTVTVPDGWSGLEGTIWLAENKPPDGAGLLFGRGAWLLTDPCQNGRDPDIPVGPTVADFVDAVAKHPILDTTTPVNVTLGGYSGKYFDLQVPADISKCDAYRPWEPGLYAQGPGHRWHQWVLDVGGVRVVVQSMEYAGTSAQRRAELRAMVDSLKIQP